MIFRKSVIVTSLFLLSSLFCRTYFVSPTGNSSNSGLSFSTAKDFSSAMSLVTTGDSILLRGGTYTVPYVSGVKNGIIFSKSGQEGKPIFVVAHQSARAIFDFSYPTYEWLQDDFGFDVRGSYWYFKGIDITRAGYQGAYVKGAHNTFNNCSFSFCKFSGIEINKGGSYTSVINCDSYKNYNVKVIGDKAGAAADGFAPKQTQGAGNVLIGCRAWENSDDGYDTFDSPEPVVMENCWAFDNGYLKVGDVVYSGNMDGFKLGGNNKVERNSVYNCIAFGNGLRGFDENSNKGGISIYNCLAYDNNVNYAFTGTLNSGESHDFRNNISLKEKSASNIKSTNKQVNNTWNSGFSVNAADFKSLDLSLALVARNPDGSLPETDLFRLAHGSRLIDAGTATGRPFVGGKPDIGPFEYMDITTGLWSMPNFNNNIVVYPTVVDREVHIRFLTSLQSASVAIYSTEGVVVYEGDLEHHESAVSCQHFKAGKYIVKVKNGELLSSFHMIKE